MNFREAFYNHKWGSSALNRREDWSPQLKMLVEIMLDTQLPMFIIWGRHQNILFNDAYADILGERAFEALGESIPELWSDVWDTAGPIFDSVHAGQACLVEDLPMRTWASEFSETRFFSFSCTPVRDTTGKVIGSITVCIDTTEKFRSAQRLTMERNAILLLFEESPGFIAMVKGREHEFVFANPSYRNLVGRDEIIGQTVREALPELVEQGFPDILDQVFSTGERFIANRMPVEFRNDTGPGQQRHIVNFVYEPLRNEDREVIGIFVQGHEVTDEVAAQEKVQLLQSELIHISRVNAMGTMASTLAHELNQPLAAIENYAEGARRLLEKEVNGILINQAMTEIIKNVARAGKIISSLRHMTRKGESIKKLIELDTVIIESGSLAALGDCHNVEIEFSCSANGHVLGDPIQIQQVAVNLIRNACEAVRHTPEGRVFVSSTSTGNLALIKFEDNGPGIEEGDLSSVFDAFFSTKIEGMGVGLSICRTIIEAHGGELWAANRPEGGACFTFSLPLASGE